MALGEGGAAAALSDDAGAQGGGEQGSGAQQQGAGGEQGSGGEQQQGSGEGGDFDWMARLSAESLDADNPSNRDYAKAKGFKTLDDVLKSYREAEKAVRASGKVVVPGADAKPDEIAAFRAAIGVPEKADDYAFTLPEGHEGVDLDEKLTGVLRAAAHAAGVPKAGFEALATSFIKAQLDMHAAEVQKQDGLRDATFAKWGAEKDAKLADCMTAKRALGFSNADIIGMQRALGSDRLFETLAKLGSGMGEDVLLDGGKNQFGVTAAEAQKEIDAIKKDPALAAKVRVKGSPEQLRWNRLIAAVGAQAERQRNME